MAGKPAILKVDIVADAKGVGRGVDDAEGKLSKLGRTAGRVGKMAAVGLAAGVAAAAVGLVKLGQAAAEDEQGQVRLAKTLENTTGATRAQVGAVEDWITKQGVAKGVADDQLRPALGRLAASTKDVGEAQKLTGLAMDIAAGTGKDLQAVSEALGKAHDGNVGGLSRLGVATKNAAGETKTFDELTKELAKTHGGQAQAAADTAAGKWGRLKLRLGELGESIGAQVLPLGNKLASWALDMAPKVEKLANKAGKVLGPALASVGEFIREKVLPIAGKLGDFITGRLAPALGTVLTPAVEAGRRAFAKIGAAIEDNRPQLEKLGGAISKVVGVFLDVFMPIVGKVVGKGFELIGNAIGLVIDAVGWLIDKVDAVIGKLREFKEFAQSIPGVGSLIGGAVGNLTTGAPSLTGGPGSLDGRRGYSTAALGGTDLWAGFTSAAAAGGIGGPTVVDARTFLDVKVDGSGIVDEARVADVIAGVLTRHAQRLGLPVQRVGTV